MPTLPASRLVDTSAAFADDLLYIEDAATHTHGPGGEHTDENIAFPTWLDPKLAGKQARAIRDALAGIRPEMTAEFDAGLGALKADLAELDQAFQTQFDRNGGRPLLFSHPVYQYLVRRYGLNAESMHWEPDQTLTDSDLEDLAEILIDHPAEIVVWEAEPLDANREALNQLGISSVVFETGANLPADGDYLPLMRKNLANLNGAL